MQSVLQIHKTIEHESVHKAVQTKRLIAYFPTGKHIRQGDVYLIALNKVPAEYTEKTIVTGYQLAPGQTQGSRHIVESALAVHSLKNRDVASLDGSVIVSETSFTLKHPEHCEFEVPAGVYQVRYQLDWSTKERVSD